MNRSRNLVGAAVTAALLSACASTPEVDPRVSALEREYEELATHPALAAHTGDELDRAQSALQRVTNPPRRMADEQFEYAIYAADRLIDVAEYAARGRLADAQRADLVREQQDLVLKARTREASAALAEARRAQSAAEQARDEARAAQAEAAAAVALREQALAEAERAQALRDAADQAREEARASQAIAEEAAEDARSKADQARLQAQAQAAKAAAAKAEAEAARAEADAAKAEMASLRSKLSELEARETDRGLVLTLGDVLFELNESELKDGAARNLKPLVEALQQRPDQQVIIEGHTDSTGSLAYNERLSEKRADAVREYLVANGVTGARITIRGLGPNYPVASNESAAGRQQNRRVEVILPQPDSTS